MASLVEHAEQQLATLCGKHGPERTMLERDVVALVALFEAQRHSGFSARFVTDALNNLLRWKPIFDPEDDRRRQSAGNRATEIMEAISPRGPGSLDNERWNLGHKLITKALLAAEGRKRPKEIAVSRRLREILLRARWIGQQTTPDDHCARAVYESREDAHEAFRALADFRDAPALPRHPMNAEGE